MSDSTENAVIAASQQFYRAFMTLDIHKMDAAWGKGDVTCVHPGWEACVGWPNVRDSWVLIFNHTQEMRIVVQVLDITARDNWAWMLCLETIHTLDGDQWVEGKVLATNIFERQGMEWKIIHHHGSPVLSRPDAS